MTGSVSVVIPTHNRRASLERLLGALASQTWHPRPAEIIVVADGCDDGTVAAVPDRTGAAPVRVIELPGCGAAIARNTGAGSAAHELLVFLDDDMEPVSDLLERYAAAAVPGVVLLGASYAHRNGGTLLDAGVRAWWEDHFRNLERPGHRYSYRDMLSGNFAITRSDFLSLGGFDTGLLCREDYEFGIRLLRAGLALEYLPAAQTTHHESPSLQVSLERAENEGCADTGILRLHPSVRSTLLISRYRDRRRRWPAAVLNGFAFRARGVGDLCARILGAGLGIMERFKMRGKWRRTYGALREYHYWRGVAGVVGDEAALRKLVRSGGDSLPDELTVDLSAGLEHASSELHRRRPDSLRITRDGIPVGRIPPMPGGERLDSRHLVPALRGQMADRLAGVMVLPDSTPATRETCGPPEDWGNNEEWRILEPVRHVMQFELTGTIPDQHVDRGVRLIQVLVRYRGRPIGWCVLDRPPGGLLTDRMIRTVAYARLDKAIAPWLLEPSTSQKSAPSPSISVVVCTRDRPSMLDRCLGALAQLSYPEYEVLVIDNASISPETGIVARSHKVRCVREERPGLDWARNRGIAEARHGIIAFTDDDACPDREWLQALAIAFGTGADAVTGLVAPLVLETRAQILFEQVYGGMGKGFRAACHRGGGSAASRLEAQRMGVGANMAFRREALRQLGGFDTGLDVGTASHGGGDLDMFYRVVNAGLTLVYEPRALVWHEHRRDMAALERQMRDDGRAFGVYLLTRWHHGDAPRGAVLRYTLGHWVPWLCGRVLQGLLGRHRLPVRLLWANLYGSFSAPWAWVATRRSDRRLRRGNGQPTAAIA